MINIKELIMKMFDKPYEFKKEKSMNDNNSFIPRPSSHYYSFKSPNDQYIVSFHHSSNHTRTSLDFQGKKANTGISNAEGKDAHKVFSTVKAIAKHHLEKNPDIENISFVGIKDNGGKSESRTKLYDTLTRKLSNNKAKISKGPNASRYDLNVGDIR